MTETSKAPTDREILAAHEIAQAKQARRTNAASLIGRATRTGPYSHRSLAQVKRSTLAGIALALGYAPSASDTKTFLLRFIEREMTS